MTAPTAHRRPPLETDAKFLKGVGPKLAEVLTKLGLNTVGDVLYYIPRRYEDRRNLPPISSIRPGQWVTVRGRLMGVEGRAGRSGKVFIKAVITDGKSSVALVWFNQPWVRRRLLQYSGDVIAYGQVKEGNVYLEIHSPEYELVEEDEDSAAFARIVPVYSLTEGVPQWSVRKATASAVENYVQYVQDPLPEPLLRKHGVWPLRKALTELHRPTTIEASEEARKRIVFDEFLYMQLALLMKRAETHQEIGIAFDIDAESLKSDMAAMLPFELTRAQKRVITDIWRDMKTPHPMNRLVQGDVGSGKTAVAACAMLAAVRAGYQAAMMAPTEILAEQHYENLRELFGKVGIEVGLLVGKQTKKQKEAVYEQTASGEVQIAVGTHAIIQEGVQFQNLGLAVIDEQHRFGVLQRAALRGKGSTNPDVLVMTATPIPRTLTMTLYGDLDLSVIDELPPGRKPIKTHYRTPEKRMTVYETIRQLIAEGRQAYVVCPMVSENEKVQALAAEELYKRLSEQVFADLRVGLLHGQMKTREKEQVMERFRKGEVDVLVATTVIEVGVDVPNASVMVIEDANRFGLSQLHQLRGRVGRGEYQSYCILIADVKSEEAKRRMDVMVETTDGFKIAEEDLQLRGPGEMLGTRQSGNLDFKHADLARDGRMLEEARQAAMEILAADPKLTRPDNRLLVQRVKEKRGDVAAIPIS